MSMFLLALVQNISFCVVSRSRNRGHQTYHMVAALFSNTVWFLTFREMVRSEMDWMLFAPYVAGTMIGSMYGVKLAMKIEKWLGATADGHVKKEGK